MDAEDPPPVDDLSHLRPDAHAELVRRLLAEETDRRANAERWASREGSRLSSRRPPHEPECQRENQAAQDAQDELEHGSGETARFEQAQEGVAADA